MCLCCVFDIPKPLISMTTEAQLETQLTQNLSDIGISFRRQVKVASGIIDILTDQSIIEVKLYLTRDTMRKGLAQLLGYARDIKPAVRELILVGYETKDTIRYAETLTYMGICVVGWHQRFDPYSSNLSLYQVRQRKHQRRAIPSSLFLEFDESWENLVDSLLIEPEPYQPLAKHLKPRQDTIEALDDAMSGAGQAGLHFMEMDTMRRNVGNRVFIAPKPSDEPDLQDLISYLSGA